MFPLISLYFSQLQSIFLCKHINSNQRRDDNVVGINGQLCWLWLCVVLVLFLGFVSWLSKPRRSVSPSPWLFTENLVHHFAASAVTWSLLQQKRKRCTHCDQHFIGIQKQNAEWHWRPATRQKIRRKKEKADASKIIRRIWGETGQWAAYLALFLHHLQQQVGSADNPPPPNQ